MVIKNKTRKRKDIINKLKFALLFLAMLGCQNPNHKSLEYPFQNVEEEISIPLKNQNSDIIDISKLTPFSWDRLYIFKPFTPIKSINSELGFTWEEANKTLINQDDSYNLLVFTIKNEVVNYIKWPRGKGDFSKIETTVYPYESAKFLLKQEKFGEQDWLFFYKEE